MRTNGSTTSNTSTAPWTPHAWAARPGARQYDYPDPEALALALDKLRRLPPLVTSWEIEQLRRLLADAEEGRRFVLQGGDCAEMLDECTSESIANKLKILLQMSLVLVQASKKPVVRVGRFAGQYAKPRSSPTETREVDGSSVTLPSYFGDMVNRPGFTVAERTPDPHLMVRAHQHAAMTLNFIRSLCDAGFADLHHPEYWDLSFFSRASLTPEERARYESMSRQLADALRFMEALGEKSVDDLSRVEFFTSHEGLNLDYESAMTRTVPRRDGWYDLSCHLPWIGERTRSLSGAHVEFFRGVRNPVGLKVGPNADPVELVQVLERLNPANEPGKVVLISRMGAMNVRAALPRLIEIVRAAGRRALWVCDPMHGNAEVTSTGVKTRSFSAVLDDLEQTFEVHAAAGRPLGGVHFELTGEDVTECLGGAAGVTEDDLTSTNYRTLCDPRLNYQQSLELAFLLARRFEGQPNA